MSESTPPEPAPSFTLFAGLRRVASGPLEALQSHWQALPPYPPPMLFDDRSGAVRDVDWRRGAAPATEAPAARTVMPARGVGRPRLGVVAREVTLLPRHWDWLALQPGGASVALRKLIDAARRQHAGRDAARGARDAAYRAMATLAGDLPGFEEAARSLFAGDRAGFEARTAPWPGDVARYLNGLAAAGWPASA